MPAQMLRESVITIACEIRWPCVVLGETPGVAAVLRAVSGGVFGSHARELAQEARGVGGEPAEDLGDQRDHLLAALERVGVVAVAVLDVPLARLRVEGRAEGAAALAAEDRFESHASSAESASDFNQTMAPDSESAETDAAARREHDGLLYTEALDVEENERSLGDR